ncbi:XRE family transcriptional regulator [Weissella soli]|uniref:hypothetical protein n=1 Tax=Weissella soli TaxID=155866 RepID=UPI0021C20F24|nr:hypothetical protein [Weissella soli]MCT8395213.1 XRE family transcriptional regulator [Weissella soli]
MGLFDVVNSHVKEMNLSIRKVEQQAGLGNGTIRTWNQSSPSVANIDKVAKVIGIETWRLIHEAKL